MPYGAVREEDYRGLLCLELANVPGGYGWVFPKGDHVNVGVGGWEREGPRLRQHLAALLPRVRDSRVEPRGRPRLPTAAGPAARAARERTSGAPRRRRRARRPALGRRDLRGVPLGEARRPRASWPATSQATSASCAGRCRPSSSAAWGAKVALDRFPRLTYAVVRTPFLWNAVVSLIGGDVPSPSAMRGLRRVSMRAVEAIARAAGNPGKRVPRARDLGRAQLGSTASR